MNRDLEVSTLGVVASSTVLPLLAIPTVELAQRLAAYRSIQFASGFQTATERAFLTTQLPSANVAIVPAREFGKGHRLYSGGLWDQVKQGVETGQVQIITPPGVKGTRITRQNAEIRNDYLLEIADVLLVLSAPPESKTQALALKAIGRGIPVFTFEHEQHQALFEAGAQEATIEAILQAGALN